MFKISMKELQRVLEDFYNLTKFKIVLYDSDRNVLVSYPRSMCRFCETVRKCPALAKKCIGCDNIGFDICDANRSPYIYKCHMSVIEAIAPIYSNEINIGYLMFGQIRPTDSSAIRAAALHIREEYGIPLSDDMVEEMTAAEEPFIKSAVNMMSMCANYLYTNEIIRNDPNIFIYRLKEFINSHLDCELTIDTICKHFYTSRSKIYKISAANFGMGITDYIKQQRIKHAKKLLRNTDKSISQIAAEVGIMDYNYFIRIFKRSEGLTPLQYRKN